MKTWQELAMATAVGLVLGGAALAEGIYTPNLAYRTGPFAATGTPIMDGQKDYMALLNARDGGIGGVAINFEECETGYSTEKGVECYERTKADAVVTQPWSTGITLQVLPKTNVDKIPILAPGYGFSPMSDGAVFQWAFNPPASYWDGASMILNEISGGDPASLKGKKIVLLHLDHPFGKEPIPLLETMAKEYGFDLVLVPVGLKEMQNQSAQWLQIRRERPDFVIMWGWGAMNAAAINEAVKTKYPMDQFVGVWWAGHDADLKQVGEAGKGYRSISWSMPQPDAPIMADLKQYVYDKGNSTAEDPDSVFYQRGLVISMMLAEGIRTAQQHFDVGEITPEQLRWGLENLDISDERLAELGMTGMVPPFKTSCDNHTGHSGGWMLEWDGTRFVQSSDLLQADASFIRPLEVKAAEEYAAENQPWPINEDCK
ncbi:ABC transporter substrate-binding protein [Tropicimonas sp. IMCC34043]|uniref:ABC transporter substrate-binding protein n=1 Tax=Tropicimonas sp. IMCC34043 TaxID=2248760 RepID=UPI000E25788B|nr:ABC transporter substrate-binding protein [Tropicimonas sp. IMCC34043]